MGLINIDPSIDDDYSAEVIRLARERSPDIDNWLTTEQYLNETHPDNLSPLWLRNRCIVKICSELDDMGVRVQRDPDDVCDAPEMVYFVLMLRTKFDPEHLFETLRDHRDLFETVRAELNGESLETIISWCKENLPLDEGWGLLGRVSDENPGIVDGENMNFVSSLRVIVERVDALGDPDITSEQDQDLVLRYIQFLAKRTDYIRQIAYDIWANRCEDFQRKSRRTLIDNLIDSGFEKTLAERGVIDQILPVFEGLHLNDLNEVVEFLNHQRKPFKKSWSHCLEYYAGEERKHCPDSVLALMLATLIVDCPDLQHVRTYIQQEVDDHLDVLGEQACAAISERFNDMLSNLINPMEISYAS